MPSSIVARPALVGLPAVPARGPPATPAPATPAAWPGETRRQPDVTYHGRVLQPDGSIRIAWHADGFEAIVVRARFRARRELEAFAGVVADVALLERSLPDLRTALRRRYPGAFDLLVDDPAAAPGRVIISFHPPPGEPNPDPW